MYSIDEDDIMNTSEETSITSIGDEQNECPRHSEDLVGNELASEETDPIERTTCSQQNGATETVQYQFREPSGYSPWTLYQSETEYRRLRNGVFPNVWRSLFPCLSCSMSIYAICRIALMTAVYGGAFTLQFTLMSALIGVPFISLMIFIGQRIGSGLVQMWFICPAFKGIGIILQIGYAIYLCYSAVHIERILPFFLDSVITNHENYKWLNNTVCDGNTSNVHWDLVANELGVYYENKIMNTEMELQGIGTFFHLFTPNILSWIGMVALAVNNLKGAFIAASVFYALGCFLFIIVMVKFYSVWGVSFATLMDIDWTNGQELTLIWFQSMREVFFTWIMFGGIILHVCSHNKGHHSLRRFLMVFVFCIIVIFCFAVLFGTSLRSGLMSHGASLHPALFDSSMKHSSQISMIYSITNSKMLESTYKLQESHFANRIIGDVFINKKTGLHSYKVLRAITEFLPALLSADCAHSISSTVVSLFYISFVMMAFAQQAVIGPTFDHFILLGCSIKVSLILSMSTGSLCIDINTNPLTILACSIDMLDQPHRFRAKLSHFFLGCIVVSVGVTICVLLSLKVGYPIIQSLDEYFSSGWIFSFLLILLIFSLLIIQRKQITFSTVIKPLLNNTDGFLFNMLKYFASWCLPIEIILVGLILFADSPVSSIEGASSGVDIKEIVAGISQCISIAFVIIFAIAIIYINAKKCDNMEECFVNSFAPQLAIVTRDSASQSSFSETISSTRDQVDGAPRYSPPPSYSTATSRQLVAEIQRSQSAEELRFHQATSQVLPVIPNTENQCLMTVLAENESPTNHASFTVGANIMESEV